VPDSEEPLIKAWTILNRELARVLYEYDPEGIGATVGAPEDEYDQISIDLIRALRDRPTASPSAQPSGIFGRRRPLIWSRP
jgi:hypothetical protein